MFLNPTTGGYCMPVYGMVPNLNPSSRTIPTQLDLFGPLVQRAQGGDRNAFGELLKKILPAMLEVCRIYMRSDAEDAAQGAVEKIVVHLHRFDATRGAFRAWALEVTRNHCRDLLRSKGRRALSFTDDQAFVESALVQHETPESIAFLGVDRKSLILALESLPENQRAAIVLFHVHEASYEDIATALDVPMGTVMTWLHRGRKRMKEILLQDGHEQGMNA